MIVIFLIPMTIMLIALSVVVIALSIVIQIGKKKITKNRIFNTLYNDVLTLKERKYYERGQCSRDR